MRLRIVPQCRRARVAGVDVSNLTMTVMRSYKSSRIRRASGSIVARHVLGQGDEFPPQLCGPPDLGTKSPESTGTARPSASSPPTESGRNLLLRHSNGARTSANVAQA